MAFEISTSPILGDLGEGAAHFGAGVQLAELLVYFARGISVYEFSFGSEDIGIGIDVSSVGAPCVF